MAHSAPLRPTAMRRFTARRFRRSAILALVAGAAIALAGLRLLVFVQAPAKAAAAPASSGSSDSVSGRRDFFVASLSGLVGGAVAFEGAPSVQADGGTTRFVFPPIDRSDKNRCKWVNSMMGQANAQRDKLLDLRECNMVGTNPAGFDVAGAIMSNGDFRNVSFEMSTLSKAVAQKAKLDGCNFKNAIVDRANFQGSSLRGVVFQNTVLTGSNFDDCDLTDTDWTDSYYNTFAIKKLCSNPTMRGTNPVTGADTYTSAGCDQQKGLGR